MKTLILATAAALVLSAPLTLAATTSHRTSNVKANSHTVADPGLASVCARLADQFDQAEAKHKADQNYRQAVALSVEGKTLCSDSKGAAGIEYIRSAMKMIGLRPQT